MVGQGEFHVPGTFSDYYDVYLLLGGVNMGYQPKEGDLLIARVNGKEIRVLYAGYDPSRAVPQKYLYGEGEQIGEPLPQRMIQDLRKPSFYGSIGAEGVKILSQTTLAMRESKLEELLKERNQKSQEGGLLSKLGSLFGR